MTKQETPDVSTMLAEPLPQHHWLEQLLGEWSFEGNSQMQPGEPPMTFTGTEKVRSIGGLWFVAESSGDMPGGGTASMIMTLGYDPTKNRYVGTWLGSMMTYLWVYEGTLDASGQRLVLESEGPSMSTPGTLARSRDIIEIKDAGQRMQHSEVLGDDGQWHPMMEITYRKKG